ncbi:MAG: hypothetical protein K2W95_33070 [Candidatus Obscuribacterales bacterium]|nr:hypothetical protein [Candidatus Obscuribacterales bacterium]
MKIAAIICVCLSLTVGYFTGINLPARGADSERVRGYIALQAKDTDIVYFNTNSSKYHIASCRACKACTHCIELTRKEAKQRGGVPCKLCGANE